MSLSTGSPWVPTRSFPPSEPEEWGRCGARGTRGSRARWRSRFCPTRWRADGGNPRPLTRVGVLGHFLQWTAGGEEIVFRCPSGKPRTMRVRASGGEPEEMPEVVGGAHMSFSPDQSKIMDVLGHKALWVSPLSGGSPEKVFEFDDSDSRIDYPRWSPDGRFILFDRFRPSGGDVWLMESFE